MGFSFTYEGNRFYIDTDGEHKIDENLTVYVKRRDFDEYGAFYRVIWFENRGESNTGIISDILDFDTTIPLEYAKTRSGYMPTEANACVTAMKGAVDGMLYRWSDEISASEEGPSKIDFDGIPKESIALISAVGGIWLALGIYFVIGMVKKNKKVK